MKSIPKALLFLVSVVIVGGALTACGYTHHTPEQRAERLVEKLTDKLELNTLQQQKLSAVKDVFLSLGTHLHSERAQWRAQALTIVATESLDQTALNQLISERIAAVEQATPQVVAALGEFYDSLMPNQQATIRTHIQEGPGRHCWHH